MYRLWIYLVIVCRCEGFEYCLGEQCECTDSESIYLLLVGVNALCIALENNMSVQTLDLSSYCLKV